MTPEERKVFENVRSPHLKYWIPVVWFSNLASKARQEGRIQDSMDLQNILNVGFEEKCSESEIYNYSCRVLFVFYSEASGFHQHKELKPFSNV